MCWATAFGGQAMSSTFGAVWDSYVPVDGTCTAGAECYRQAVYIAIAFVAVGLAVCLVFSWRQKPTDNADYVRRQQELEDSDAALATAK